MAAGDETSGSANLDPATLDLSEQIARVIRMQEETIKFVAEQHKLMAEAAKLNRDRWLAPLLAIVTVLGGLLGLATFLARVI